MTGAYDCNYDFVDDPKQALVEAHEEIRELESQHAEREAISEGADALYGDGYDAEAATLRKLLERLT